MCDEQLTSSTSLGTSRSVSRNLGNFESDDHASGICQEGEPNAEALYGPEGYENMILTMES